MTKESVSAAAFNELILLSTLRRRAEKMGLDGKANRDGRRLKVALIGGSTLYPLSDLIEHMLAVSVGNVEHYVGGYNNYRSEIFENSSDLYDFQPAIVIILPDEQSCMYHGNLTDSRQVVDDAVEDTAGELLQLCSVLHDRTSAEVILCNYVPSPYIDLGPLRSKNPTSEWNFKKAVNLALGTKAPNYVHICDMEFLAYRAGGLTAKDERSWFESKQAYSPALQVGLAKEVAHIIKSLKRSPKKVLVLDLDNTLWGGVIGDDGMEGIELGDTSPKGEAFKAFQSYILSLTERGLLLGVCSKNDHEVAIAAFRRHPEMVLREEHFVSFKANWNPKGQNLIEMANELSLLPDSFIFVDDNPAEIENVRQFAPDVTTILLDPDPSNFVRQLKESRLFERLTITDEDTLRTTQYKQEAERKTRLDTAVNMDSYLESLSMEGTFSKFNSLDLPRVAQLVNKSNQFNLTTRRRTESEIAALTDAQRYIGFSMRLADRFGDHGLISVVICFLDENHVLEIDTWLMSCRVLKRQVEEEVLNEIVRIAVRAGCMRVKGVYHPTAKNGMVRDHYSKLGFQRVCENQDVSEFELNVDGFSPFQTFINIESASDHDEYYPTRSASTAAIHF
ncbi:MAG: HAD-IIIC family phosphatase [Pyrinomonadaceae bacterium]